MGEYYLKKPLQNGKLLSRFITMNDSWSYHNGVETKCFREERFPLNNDAACPVN